MSDEKILVVDDEPLVSDIIEQCLDAEGYDCSVAECAETALDLLQRHNFSLIVSDMNMPGKSGIDLLSIVNEKYPDIAFIMVTAVNDRKTAIKALQLGAYGYVIKPFDLNEIVISVVNALERRRLTRESKEYETRLENDVKDRTAEIRQREEEICVRLTSACEYRDEETGTHNRRLGLYASVLAQEIGWPQKLIDEVRLAAQMHDIGKIAVPDNILLKAGRLNDSEFDIIKRHTTIGGEILNGSNVSLLNMARDIALYHHERWEGSGYPKGLKGEVIPESARLVALIDVYDALVHKRVYRPALSEQEAIDIMHRDRGSHFDPNLYDAFVRVLPVLQKIRHEVKDPDEQY